jgi:hypothetical protein
MTSCNLLRDEMQSCDDGATMLSVAGRTFSSSSLSSRNIFADAFAARLIMLGAAALGFLVTFLIFGHEIHGLRNVVLPLLFIVPSYLLLMSLNTWWGARLALQIGPRTFSCEAERARTHSVNFFWPTLVAIAFGTVAALVYIHCVK